LCPRRPFYFTDWIDYGRSTMTEQRVSSLGELDTYTGLMVSVENPQPSTIVIEDIAHATANLCRYAGHCKEFYSIAEHLVLGSYLPRDTFHQVAYMCHDMSEAYCLDLIRPLKRLLPQYRVIENRFEKVIYTKFIGRTLTDEEHAIVKAADNQMLLLESATLLTCGGIGWSEKWADNAVMPKGIEIHCWAPKDAERKLLERWHDLQLRRGEWNIT